MEQRSVVLFLRLKGVSKKAIYRELVAVLYQNAVSDSSVTRFSREAILGLNSEETSSSPKDDNLDEVNKAILLALSDEPSSSEWQIAVQDMRSKTHCISSACRFPAVHIQTSDIFIGLLTSFAIARKQVKPSCRSKFAISCCPSCIKDRMRIHIGGRKARRWTTFRMISKNQKLLLADDITLILMIEREENRSQE
jgi:hypothetical protein